MKKRFLCIALFVVLTLSILGKMQVPVHSQTLSQTLILGMVTPPPTTFAQTATNWGGAITITQIPYLYAYTFGINGQAVPVLTNLPEPVPGSNTTQWIINLRSSDMKWSDGYPINSTDLAYSYGIFLGDGPYANMSLDNWGAVTGFVKSVSIINSTAIMITAFGPYPLWPVRTWLYAIYPWHYYKQFTGDNVVQQTSIVAGPGDTAYVPVNYDPTSKSMRLVANPSSPSWNGATPTLNNITIQFFTDESALVNALIAGTVNAAQISISDVSALQAEPNLNIEKMDSAWQMFYTVWPSGYPWSNTDFRKALMYLVNKQQIDSVLYSSTLPLGNSMLILPQAMSTYWPGPGAATYDFSTVEAVNHLRAAGLTQNSNGNWVTSNGTVVAVTVEASNSDPDLVRAAQFIANSTESVGLKVNLKIVDLATATNDLYNPYPFNTILYIDEFFPSPYRWMYSLMTTWPWTNSTFYDDLFRSLNDTDPVRSLADMKQTELILADAAILNSVVVLPQYVAYDNKFTNWVPALDQAPSYDVFSSPIITENVMASVTPAGLVSSSTTMSASSTSGNASMPFDMTSIVAVVLVVLVVIAAVAALRFRKRK
jgi:ABC-type transport system substrate-binding protein